MDAQGLGHLEAVPDGEGHTLQHRLDHIGAGSIHGHAQESGAGVGIVDGAALAHQVGQEEDPIGAQLLVGDVFLLGGVILGFENFVTQPLVAAGGGEHAAHQMEAPVGMSKGMQAVGIVHAEFLGGDEHGAGSAQADVARAVAHGAGAHGGGGIVPRARHDLSGLGQADISSDIADDLEALKQLGHLTLADAADIQHLPAPALMLHIQQQHAGGVGVVAGMDAGELIVDEILGQHDPADAPEILRLVLLHPQELGGGEPGEGNVSGELGQLFLADHIVEVVHLLVGAAVVPEDRGADHPVVLVQNDQAVHLAAAAHTGYLADINIPGQLLQAVLHRRPPVLGVLLGPAGMREKQGIIPGNGAADLADAIHQQQLDGGCAQVNTDKILHENASFNLSADYALSLIQVCCRGK